MAMSAANREKVTVWSRVIVEPTIEPRAANHRPILSYLILLRVAEPLDICEQAGMDQPDIHDAASRALSEKLCVLGQMLGNFDV
jgi:hypothetical protein